jgi:4-hydroxy-tetrahydrodipicolinate synthase
MSKLTEDASGVYVIAVTPFHADGAIDLDSTDRMVDFYLSTGATGLTILGIMGEAPKLTAEESLTVVQRVVRRVAGRVPVVVGVSAAGFAQVQTLSHRVMDDGAACVMIAPPGNLRTDDQIVTYYQQAASFIGDTPFVLQDFPLATGVQISVPSIRCRPASASSTRIGRGWTRSRPCARPTPWVGASRSCAAMAVSFCPRKWNAARMVR